MLTSDSRRKLTAMAMLAMPTGLVWMAGMLIGGPGVVRADPLTPAIAVMVPDVTPVLDDAASQVQRAATEHIERLRSEPFALTPLYHDPNVAGGGVTQDPVLATAPTFTIQAIMATSTESVALINGDWLRVGDPLGQTAWFVFDIDGDKRSVTIQHRVSGHVRTGTVKGPGQ